MQHSAVMTIARGMIDRAYKVMETQMFKDMIAVIKAEQQRRGTVLNDADANFANDHWLFKDMPFINELCLMLMVALWHQVERELVRLAARAADGGREISGKQYQENVLEERKQLKEKRA